MDVQSVFLDQESSSFVPASRAIVPGIASLISAYRGKGLPVIFTRHALADDEEPGIMGCWWGDVIKDDDPLSQIYPGLAPLENETVLRKSKYSAFTNPNLEAMLRGMGVSTLVVCGVLTHLCVETTARDAFMRDFEVYVPVDATASDTEELHMSALRTLAHGFAIPVAAAGIIQELEGRK